MFARTMLYTLSLSAYVATGPSMIVAMRRLPLDNDMFHERGALARILTAQSAVGIGACLDDSNLPAEIKAPLFTALFVVGTYGLDWHKPSTVRSPLLKYVAEASTLVGMGYILKQIKLSSEFQGRIFCALVGVSLWRLSKTKFGKSDAQ